MTKKNYGAKIRSTVQAQDKALDDRFEKADSIQLIPSAVFPAILKKKSNTERDTFSMPLEDHALIEELRTTAAKIGYISSKSEIIRAGLQTLKTLEGSKLVATLGQLVKVKPGRKS